MSNWAEHVKAISLQGIPVHFVIAQLSQAILESGRGTSKLFLTCNNPYGMKYRKEFGKLATPYEIEVSDGKDIYANFPCVASATLGYWVFINRAMYLGWEKTVDENQFITHLLKSGFAGDNIHNQASYLGKIRHMFPEARHIVQIMRQLYL